MLEHAGRGVGYSAKGAKQVPETLKRANGPSASQIASNDCEYARSLESPTKTGTVAVKLSLFSACRKHFGRPARGKLRIRAQSVRQSPRWGNILVRRLRRNVPTV